MESTECTAQTRGIYPEIKNIDYKYSRLGWKVRSVLRKPGVITLKYRTLNTSTVGWDGKYGVYCTNLGYLP